jgi:hypothetical protein
VDEPARSVRLEPFADLAAAHGFGRLPHPRRVGVGRVEPLPARPREVDALLDFLDDAQRVAGADRLELVVPGFGEQRNRKGS